MIEEIDLWDNSAPPYVVDGDVVNWRGRPVNFKSLIQRRWGWPKKAAFQAADLLLADAEQTGRPAILWLDNPHRDEQQFQILDRIGDSLLSDLFSGLARGGSRERHDMSRKISEVKISFSDQSVTDDGMIRSILFCVANRLGCNLEELRDASRFGDNGKQRLTIDVANAKFCQNENE